MARIRWEPAAELNTIQNEMNRLFNTFFEQPAPAATQRRWIPAMDLAETADHYRLRADLPGVDQDDISIQLEDNVLMISGSRQSETGERGEHLHRSERAFGSFSRSLTLPEGVDPDRVEAHFDRGVLEILIPKPEQRKPRQVHISVTNRAPEAIGASGPSKAPVDAQPVEAMS